MWRLDLFTRRANLRSVGTHCQKFTAPRFSMRLTYIWLGLFVSTVIHSALPANGHPAGDRPNVVVIMVDDLGYSDLGCYGSEIDTPNLDRLAANGLRFSQFYNTAKCHSSRVSLLTGQYCIAAGDTSLSHAVTSAEVLASNDYFTAMTGKWHLKKQPTDFGFHRYFGHLSGACNFFKGDKTFRLNGQPWKVPLDGFYTTVADVDFALRFLSEAREETQRPWYLYVAFNAPHAPLHALPEDYAKYKGKYRSGWDDIRTARIAKQRELGLLPESSIASVRPEHIPAWDDMEPWRQDYEANRMTTLAAMIDRVDQEVGRLIRDLEFNDELENTMILFVSDNGACPYDRKKPLLNVEPTNGDIALADSTGWAWARNAPFRFYKQNQFEGGISTPAIVHWPEGLDTPPGSIVHEPAHLIDVLPTLAEITGSTIPNAWPDRDVRPVSGISLVPVFKGNTLEREQPIHFLFSKDRALRDGEWKAVSFRGETWELYRVDSDRCETNNLATSHPERLEKMAERWTSMTKNVLHGSHQTYSPPVPATLPHRHREWTKFDSEKPDPEVRNEPRSQKSIRARKNTKLTIKGSTLQLRFTGDDPGIAIDRLGELPSGPYRLTFELLDSKGGDGELFVTTDPKTILPKGKRIPFSFRPSQQWQPIAIEIPGSQRIHKLRLDISEGPGEAALRDLSLRNPDGKILKQWP